MTHPRQPTEPAVPQTAIPVAKPPPVWPLWVLAMLPGGFWVNLFAGPMMRKRAYKRGFVTGRWFGRYTLPGWVAIPMSTVWGFVLLAILATVLSSTIPTTPDQLVDPGDPVVAEPANPPRQLTSARPPESVGATYNQAAQINQVRITAEAPIARGSDVVVNLRVDIAGTPDWCVNNIAEAWYYTDPVNETTASGVLIHQTINGPERYGDRVVCRDLQTDPPVDLYLLFPGTVNEVGSIKTSLKGTVDLVEQQVLDDGTTPGYDVAHWTP